MKATTVLAIGLAALELGLGFVTIVLADPDRLRDEVDLDALRANCWAR